MREYQWFLNQVVGILGISLTMSSLSSGNPRLFGFISFIVVLGVLWGGYRRHESELEDTSQLTTTEKLRMAFSFENTPYFIGLLMLGMVVVGVLQSDGFHFP